MHHLKLPLCKGRWIFAEQKAGGIDRNIRLMIYGNPSVSSADSSLIRGRLYEGRRTKERAIRDRPYMGIRFNQPRRDTRPRVSVRIDTQPVIADTPGGVSLQDERRFLHYLKPPLCKGRWIFAKQKFGGIDRNIRLMIYGNPSVSLRLPACGPGRNHRLLPPLAKNVPLAHFLNASAPLHKGAFGVAEICSTERRFHPAGDGCGKGI